MSFMAGFGQGFSDSWKQGEKRDAEEERDVFKLTFDQYVKNQDADKSDMKKDREDAKAAASVAKMLGPDVKDPKAAMAQAYEFIKAGWTQDQVLKELRKGGTEMGFDPSVRQASGLDEQTDEAVEGSAAQTGIPNSSGPQAAPSATAQPQEKSWKDTFAGGLFNSPYSKKDRMLNNAQQKIADSTGQTLEQVQQTVRGGNTRAPLIDTTGLVFTPGKDEDSLPKSAEAAHVAAQEAFRNGNEAEGNRLMAVYQDYMNVSSEKERQKVAAATGVQPGSNAKVLDPETGRYRLVHVAQGPADENGRPTFIDVDTGQPLPEQVFGFSKLETDRREFVAKELAKETASHTNAMAGYGNVLASAGQIVEIAKRSPAALTTGTATGASWINQFKTEGINAYNLAYDVVNGNVNRSIASGKFTPESLAQVKQESAKGMEAIDKAFERGAISQVAADRARIELYRNTMVYEVGAAFNQSGRDLSNEDANRFKAMVSEGVDANQVMDSLAELLNQLEGNIDRRSQALFTTQNPLVNDFDQEFRYNPFESSARSVRENVIDRNESLQPTYNLLKSRLPGQQGQVNRPVTNTSAPAQGQMAQPAPVRIPKSAAQHLASNPTPENIEFFKKTFPGASDAVIDQILQQANNPRGE